MAQNSILSDAQSDIRDIVIGAHKDIKSIIAPILTPRESRQKFLAKSVVQLQDEIRRDPQKALSEIMRHAPKGE